MKYLLDEGIKQMTRQHLGFRLEGSEQVIKKKITKVKVPLPFFQYINDFRIEHGTLFVCKLPSFKVYFKKDNPYIYISEEVTEGFFEAEIYAIEKKRKISGEGRYVERMIVPFYDTKNGRILLMKLEDHKKTECNAPRLIGCWEASLDDKIQEIYLRYARDNLKVENLLVQYPVALICDRSCYYAMYWNEFKRETEAMKVEKREADILKDAGYLDRSYVQENPNPASSEGISEEFSAADEEQ
jgi:hypothetical protein